LYLIIDISGALVRMKIKRNDDGIVYGDLDVDGSFPATVRSEIAPVLCNCGVCERYRWHVVAVQPYGLNYKLPFARKPLLSTGKARLLVCNTCINITDNEDHIADMLKDGVVATVICDDLDWWLNGRLCSDCDDMYLLPTETCQNCGGPITDEDDDYVPEACPKPYTLAWKELWAKDGTTPAGGDCSKWLDAYRREDGLE
jgi:hypothetical protein